LANYCIYKYSCVFDCHCWLLIHCSFDIHNGDDTPCVRSMSTSTGRCHAGCPHTTWLAAFLITSLLSHIYITQLQRSTPPRPSQSATSQPLLRYGLVYTNCTGARWQQRLTAFAKEISTSVRYQPCCPVSEQCCTVVQYQCSRLVHSKKR